MAMWRFARGSEVAVIQAPEIQMNLFSSVCQLIYFKLFHKIIRYFYSKTIPLHAEADFVKEIECFAVEMNQEYK